MYLQMLVGSALLTGVFLAFLFFWRTYIKPISDCDETTQFILSCMLPLFALLLWAIGIWATLVENTQDPSLYMTISMVLLSVYSKLKVNQCKSG